MRKRTLRISSIFCSEFQLGLSKTIALLVEKGVKWGYVAALEDVYRAIKRALVAALP